MPSSNWHIVNWRWFDQTITLLMTSFHLWYPPSVLHLSHGFQCSPTLNRQPYEARLPLTSGWRKSSKMTAGQSSLISSTQRYYDWHPRSRCGCTYNQLTSKVDEGITGSWLRCSTLTWCATPQYGNQVSTSLGNNGLCWTVFAWNRDIAVPAEGNGDLQTLICVLAARPRRCPTLSNPVPWQNWMAAYLGYTLQMLFHGWPVMVHDTHTRKRRMKPAHCRHSLLSGDVKLHCLTRAQHCTVVMVTRCVWTHCT